MAYVVLFASQRSVGPEGIDRLARALGRTWIEARQWTLNASPRVIARAGGAQDAERCVRALREEGLDAEWVDESEVTSSAKMQRIRAVRVLDGLLECDGNVLAYSDVRALVRAKLVSNASRSTVDVERVEAGRGVTVVVATQKTERERVVEEALFVFGAHGERWLLVHNAVRYAALGVALRPVQRENFEMLVSMLRERLPRERYDDSMCAATTSNGATGDAVRSMDVLVHAIARRCGGAMRHPMR
ncbi:MAG: hypothetical protein U0269_28860 [Polyangiales bacterium]